MYFITAFFYYAPVINVIINVLEKETDESSESIQAAL